MRPASGQRFTSHGEEDHRLRHPLHEFGQGTPSPISEIGVLLEFGGSQLVGGTAPAARNVIGPASANVYLFQSSGNNVQGNLIGTNPAGTAASGAPSADGIAVQTSTSNVIGGTTAAARNVISGNSTYGVVLQEQGSSGTGTNGNTVPSSALISGAVVTADETKTVVSGGFLETSEFSANVTVG